MSENRDLTDRLRWLKKLRAGIPKTSDKISAETLEIWSRRLVKVEMPVLLAAANVLLERHTFFPALAEILKVCTELQEDRADRAWVKRVEQWEQEAITGAEARKMLEAVNEKAGAAGIKLVKTHGGFSKVVATKGKS